MPTPLDTDEKTAPPQLMAPVKVTMIAGAGTGTGDGGPPMPSGTIGHTASAYPNVVVQVITPLVAIGVRAGNLFLTTFLGLLTAAGVGVKLFGGSDFEHLIRSAAWASLIVAGMGVLKDAVTIFSGLEKKYPLASGSV